MVSKTISNTCAIPGCPKSVHGHGWCDNHYRLWKNNGDPLIKKLDRSRTPEQRFWTFVNKNGPVHPVLKTRCWLWLGAKQEKGHGTIALKGKTAKAHRFSFFLAHGHWPDRWALHKCDNPPCVNPDHLYDGDAKDNSDDKIRRGRGVWVKGEANKRHKLTDDDVRSIRLMLSAGRTQRDIASTFSVNQRVVWNIHNRRSWSHVL